jgi:hypothetical protein
VTSFGAATVAFWLSLAVFPQRVYPLAPLPDAEQILGQVKGVQPWIREKVPSLKRPDEEIVASLRREVFFVFVRLWAEILAGAASGVLIARRSRIGRWLALALCGLSLASFIVGHFRLAWEHEFIAYWTSFARVLPMQFARSAVNVLFFVATLVYLTRRRVALQFAPNPSS